MRVGDNRVGIILVFSRWFAIYRKKRVKSARQTSFLRCSSTDQRPLSGHRSAPSPPNIRGRSARELLEARGLAARNDPGFDLAKSQTTPRGVR